MSSENEPAAVTKTLRELKLDDGFPCFTPEYQQQLDEVYKTLTTSESSTDREAALEELEKTPDVLKEFLRKTLPPYGFLPALPQKSRILTSLFIPRIESVYEEQLERIHNTIRSAQTQEEREVVLDEVVANPYLVKEFLKKNVPQLSHL